MQYALLCYETRDDFAAREDPSQIRRLLGRLDGLRQGAQASRHLRFRRRVPAARHRHQRSGRKSDKRTVHDGPYADSKEQLGGFYVIDVPDLDAALAWAAQMPLLGGRHDGSAAASRRRGAASD